MSPSHSVDYRVAGVKNEEARRQIAQVKGTGFNRHDCALSWGSGNVGDRQESEAH